MVTVTAVSAPSCCVEEVVAMMSRRRAREVALQALYQCDTLGDWSNEAIDLFFSTFGARPEHDSTEDSQAPEKKEQKEQNDHDNVEFCHRLIQGARDELESVDKQLTAASTHWSISRMARVDRNILRIACYEILFLSDIPVNVSINEAIEIAKLYGSEDSPTFINGVLDKIAKQASRANGPRSKEAA